MKTNTHFWSYLVQFFLEWEMFQTNVVGKIKTHFVFSNFFFFENRAVYEIMWKNFVDVGRPKMIKRMRIASWIPKFTEYVILIAFPLQQRLHERASVLCYTYIACLVRHKFDCQTLSFLFHREKDVRLTISFLHINYKTSINNALIHFETSLCLSQNFLLDGR